MLPLTPTQAQQIAVDLNETAAEHEAAVQDQQPPLPERIGSYRIIRLIGDGGMGRVYEAEQTYPHRTVALKVLRRDLVSRTTLRRFQYEAEVLARLQHPGIAQIYEAGTHDDGTGGVPYFAMEYILGGQPITQFACDRGLPLSDRLELFARVCDAVHYGHQNRIIHRDLKPANILVAADPKRRASGQGSGTHAVSGGEGAARIKVIDFGIACATDSDITLATLHTDAGTILGTLQYMSPEQAGGGSNDGPGFQVESPPDERSRYGSIDTRTDVYSLGVILYELVCDRLPYELAGLTITHALRIIEETEPPRPVTLWETRPRNARALEAIVLKAMAKDRRRRYQSAAALADDVRRYLRGEPVEAKPPSRWMRGVRWVGKHPIAAGAAASIAIVLATIALTALGWWWMNRQPFQFGDITDNGRTCHLLSRSGIPLATLGGMPKSHVLFATTADRPEEFGGGRFALFNVRGQRGENLTNGQLFVTPINDLKNVRWRTHGSAPYIVTPAPVSAPHDCYMAHDLFIANVFDDDEHPGDEIIVLHHTDGPPGSPCALRIYNWAGEVLFEAWHMGPLRHVAWLPESRLLVVAGDRHGIDWDKANQWIDDQEKSDVRLAQGNFPGIVIGIQPTPGTRVAWLNDETDAEAQAVVKWYRCIKPISLASVFQTPVTALTSMGTQLQLQLVPSANLEAGLTLIINAAGERVDFDPSDGYRRLLKQGQVPSFEPLHLGLMPPICETLEETAARWDRGGG